MSYQIVKEVKNLFIVIWPRTQLRITWKKCFWYWIFTEVFRKAAARLLQKMESCFVQTLCRVIPACGISKSPIQHTWSIHCACGCRAQWFNRRVRASAYLSHCLLVRSYLNLLRYVFYCKFQHFTINYFFYLSFVL